MNLSVEKSRKTGSQIERSFKMSGGETKQRINELEAEIARLRDAQPTLRDQFAMAAISGNIRRVLSDEQLILLTEWAYEIADAMMEARNVKD